MNNNFINNLEQYLIDKEIREKDIKEIISDYTEFYEGYLERGLTEEEITFKLGTPNEIYQSLRNTLKKKALEHKWQTKLIGVMPFISLIIFMLIGLLGNVWNPTWLVFFLVPISAILFNGEPIMKKLTAVSPFIAVAGYLIIGILHSIWHPTWLIFMIIPITGILSDFDTKNFSFTGLSLFIGLILGIALASLKVVTWKYSWLFFLLFLVIHPLEQIIKKKDILKNIVLLTSLIISIGLYLTLVILDFEIIIALLSFVIFLVTGIFTKTIFVINVNFELKNKVLAVLILTIIALFILIGIMYQNWRYIWLILLLIPISAIILTRTKENPLKLTQLMPFIAVIIFFSLGYFYELWKVAWLAYLLVPIVAIIENNKD